jgi:hypothetical protein
VIVAVVVMVTALLLLLVVGAVAAAVDDGDGDVIGALCGFRQFLTSSMVARWQVPLAKNLQLISRDHVASINRRPISQKLTSHVK